MRREIIQGLKDVGQTLIRPHSEGERYIRRGVTKAFLVKIGGFLIYYVGLGLPDPSENNQTALPLLCAKVSMYGLFAVMDIGSWMILSFTLTRTPPDSSVHKSEDK